MEGSTTSVEGLAPTPTDSESAVVTGDNSTTETLDSIADILDGIPDENHGDAIDSDSNVPKDNDIDTRSAPTIEGAEDDPDIETELLPGKAQPLDEYFGIVTANMNELAKVGGIKDPAINDQVQEAAAKRALMATARDVDGRFHNTDSIEARVPVEGEFIVLQPGEFVLTESGRPIMDVSGSKETGDEVITIVVSNDKVGSVTADTIIFEQARKFHNTYESIDDVPDEFKSLWTSIADQMSEVNDYAAVDDEGNFVGFNHLLHATVESGQAEFPGGIEERAFEMFDGAKDDEKDKGVKHDVIKLLKIVANKEKGNSEEVEELALRVLSAGHMNTASQPLNAFARQDALRRVHKYMGNNFSSFSSVDSKAKDVYDTVGRTLNEFNKFSKKIDLTKDPLVQGIFRQLEERGVDQEMIARLQERAAAGDITTVMHESQIFMNEHVDKMIFGPEGRYNDSGKENLPTITEDKAEALKSELHTWKKLLYGKDFDVAKFKKDIDDLIGDERYWALLRKSKKLIPSKMGFGLIFMMMVTQLQQAEAEANQAAGGNRRAA